MLTVNLEKLKTSRETPVFVIDFLMLVLVSINLAWLIFDSLMTLASIETFMAEVLPSFTAFYMTEIHSDYFRIDRYFVAVFILEFLGHWLFAIKQKTYHRWFFYPFIHWYDLVGCIPLGGFRWLRLLRIFSIAYRLQRYGIVDFGATAIGRFVKKYYQVLVEEVSDRVVENVLQGARDEVNRGGPVIDKIIEQVILTRQDTLTLWMTQRVNQIWEEVYLPNQSLFKRYVDQKVARAIQSEARAAALEAVPVVGPKLVEAIYQTVSDVVYSVVDQLVTDFGKYDTDSIIRELTDEVIERMLQPNQHFSDVSKQVLTETIDILIKQVRVQRWKLAENT